MLPYVAAALLVVLSLGLGGYCLFRLNKNRAENARLAANIQEGQEEIQRLKGEGEKVQQLLTPDQKSLLTAAHKLVANKAFGWSRLFADLEGVLPGSVSASRIVVGNVYQEGDRIKAELEFSVISKDYQSIRAMIDNMSNSGLFQADLRGQDLQKNERVTFTEYSFRLIYTPGYGYSQTPQTDIAQNQQGGVQ